MGKTNSQKDDWSPRRFYRTMLWVYRDRGVPPKNQRPVGAPFYMNRVKDSKLIGLTSQEFQATQALYVARAVSGLRRHTPHALPWDRCLPDIDGITGPDPQDRKHWELSRLAHQACFADTAVAQSAARKALRSRLRGRPTPVTRRLQEFLRALPQARAKIGGRDWLKLVRYHAGRQFMWNFLRAEVRAAEGTHLKWVPRRHLQTNAEELAEYYSHLKMTPEQILRGLTNPRQADADTGKKFGLSIGYVRLLCSQRRPTIP